MCSKIKMVFALIGMVALWSPSAFAQINVESFAAQSTESGWGAYLKGNGTFMSGNVNLLYLRSDLGVRYLTLHDSDGDEAENAYFKDRVLLTGYYTRKEAAETILDNEWYLHLRYTRMQWKHVGADFYVQQQFDEFHRLISRTLLGTGIRGVVFNNKRVGLWFGSGYMAEAETRNLPELSEEPVDVQNHRWSNYATLSWHIVPDHLHLSNTVYYQPRFDDFNDIQALGEGKVNVPVSDRISLGLSWVLRYDSMPPADVEPLDVKTLGFINIILL